jgi:hypothetical protein
MKSAKSVWTGTSFATGRPCRVITIPPGATRLSRARHFCLNSVTLIVLMPLIVKRDRKNVQSPSAEESAEARDRIRGKVPAPDGAMECSHGWSPGLPGRNPWCTDSRSRPGGAEETRLACGRAAAGVSSAPPGPACCSPFPPRVSLGPVGPCSTRGYSPRPRWGRRKRHGPNHRRPGGGEQHSNRAARLRSPRTSVRGSDGASRQAAPPKAAAPRQNPRRKPAARPRASARPALPCGVLTAHRVRLPRGSSGPASEPPAEAGGRAGRAAQTDACRASLALSISLTSMPSFSATRRP